jgi:hypothetical protein
MTSVAERLLTEHDTFSPSVLAAVAEFTEQQSRYDTYQDFLRDTGVDKPQVVTFDGYAPVQILDIRPEEYDPDKALVIHAPMAIPLDPNHIYQTACVAATNPDKRVIAMGGIGGLGYGYGLLTRAQRQQVAQGNMRPVIDPLLKYLDTQKITQVWHEGDSCGADKAVVSASAGSQAVEDLIVIEPASVIKRTFLQLACTFATTAQPIDRYTRTSKLPLFDEARKDSAGLIGYGVGLARLSNIAIAHALKDGKFAERMHQFMTTHTEARTTVIWGSESELAIDGIVQRLARDLQASYSPERVHAMRLLEHKHALGNDVPLRMALILEALQPRTMS